MSPVNRRNLTTPPVDGIVLAAGRSRRMGRPKPLLRVDGETFLERAVKRLVGGGCRSVNVVACATDEAVLRLARALGAAVVMNDDAGSEQIQSVRLAVTNLPPDSGAMVILPVDFPRVSVITVRAVVEAYVARRAHAVVPYHNDQPGHPVLIARALFRVVLDDALPEGLRSLLDGNRPGIERLAVSDAGALLDIDTPEEYAQLEPGPPV